MTGPELRHPSWASLLADEQQRGSEATISRSYRPPRSASSEPTPQRPKMVLHLASDGDFALEGVLGEGGMGVVTRAQQTALDRAVALKRSRHDSPEARATFLAESLVTARLDHANIVPVYLLGETPEQEQVLAMKLVDGGSWAELIEAGATLDEHLRIALAVCNALAYAHDAGVIHRDLKPSNVMVGRYGQVYLMDWGLAAATDAGLAAQVGIQHTAGTRSVCGTPAYMAPELARADGDRQGPATDVFLLGACLHEILAGEPPYGGGSVFEVLLSAAELRPRQLPADAPVELARLCARAMAPEPAERPSVAAFAEGIRDFHAHRQAYALLERGRDALAQIAPLAARWRVADASERRALTVEIHSAHAAASAAFEHAETIHPDAPELPASRAELVAAMIDHASEAEDERLLSLLLPHADPHQTARLQSSLARVEGRGRELDSLRRAAARRDWSEAAAPTGTLFIIGGLICGALAVITSWLIEHRPQTAHAELWVLWLTAAGLIGLRARYLLRDVRGSAVSRQVIGTWFAVIVGTCGTGWISEMRGAPPLVDLCFVMMLFAVGFAAMASLLHRGLWIAAALCFGSALWMGVAPRWSMEITGATWLLVLVSVGVGMRRAAAQHRARRERASDVR